MWDPPHRNATVSARAGRVAAMDESTPPTDEADRAGLTDRALERRARRYLRSQPFACFVQAAPGLEETVLAELRAAGLGDGAVAEHGGVAAALDVDGIMRANLTLRTASRILLRLASFAAGSEAMVFDQVRRVAWEVHLGASGRFALRLSARDSRLQAGDGLARTIAGGIARRMGSLGLPAERVDDGALTIHARLKGDRATLSLDTSGEHLHRRGLRRHVHGAPVRETVAAGLALATLGDHDVVLDPFCGSGTLLVEAGDIAAGLPAGRARSFAFEAAAWHRPGRWRAVQREAAAEAERAHRPNQPRLVGSDLDPAALAAASHNLAAAGHAAELTRADAAALDLDAVGAARGLLLANVPFGVRLGDRRGAARLLEAFLDRLGAARSSWDVGLLTMHPEVVRAHGALRSTRAWPIVSGGLRVTAVVGTTAVADAP